VSKANKRERQRQNREAARLARIQAEKRAKQRRLAIRLGIPLLVLVALLLWLNNSGSSKKKTSLSPPGMTIDTTKTYTTKIVTSEGTIEAALDAKNNPQGTNNFVFLARDHFYDGLTFHRAAKDFVIQGGDPKGDGSGGPGYTIQVEKPTGPYKIGDLAYAKTGADPPGSAGSQFFVITGARGVALPQDYAYFGHVTKGLDVAKKIESYAPPSGDGKPTKQVKIEKVTIDGPPPVSATKSSVATTTTKGGATTTAATTTTGATSTTKKP